MPIKANAEIEAIADQLAALRGQSVEEVVAAALRAELAREPNGRRASRPAKLMVGQRAKVARILEMVRAAGPADGEGGDRTAFLYDDQGLPTTALLDRLTHHRDIVETDIAVQASLK